MEHEKPASETVVGVDLVHHFEIGGVAETIGAVGMEEVVCDTVAGKGVEGRLVQLGDDFRGHGEGTDVDVNALGAA